MDDDRLVRRTATELLTHLGYRVETVKDGSEAVELFFRAREQGDPFSCLIMDRYVPGGMGGLEAIRRIRRVDSKVWAVISSGDEESPDQTGDQAHGPQAFLTKPYRMDDLKRVMTRIRGRRQGKKAG
jgi:CheY-like chemotaxis protein